jgi:microcystin-dependent protein
MKFKQKMSHLAVSAVLAGSALLGSSVALACADGYESVLGVICMTAASYCPRNTLEANGQILNIQQNTALYTLLGTTYGGDGRNTFALPDLRGRVPVGIGQGRELGRVEQGEMRGSETVKLTVPQLPVHYHSQTIAQVQTPTGATTDGVLANVATTAAANAEKKTTINNATAVGNTGAGAPVPVISPQLGVRYCVVSQGIYPSRPD